VTGTWKVEPDPTPPGAFLQLPANFVLPVPEGTRVAFSKIPSPYALLTHTKDGQVLWDLPKQKKVSENRNVALYRAGVIKGVSPDGTKALDLQIEKSSVIDCLRWRTLADFPEYKSLSVSELQFVTADTLLGRVYSSTKGGLWLFDTAGNIKHTLKDHPFANEEMFWTASGTGRLIVAMDVDGNIYLWETATGELRGRLTFPSDPRDFIRYKGLAVSPDGRLLAGVRDWGDRFELHFFDLRNGHHLGGLNYQSRSLTGIRMKCPLEWFPDGRGWRLDQMLISRTDGRIRGIIPLDVSSHDDRFLVGSNQVLLCPHWIRGAYPTPVVENLQTFTIPPEMVPPPWSADLATTSSGSEVLIPLPAAPIPPKEHVGNTHPKALALAPRKPLTGELNPVAIPPLGQTRSTPWSMQIDPVPSELVVTMPANTVLRWPNGDRCVMPVLPSPFVAVEHSGEISVWNLQTLEKVKTLPPDQHPDAERLIGLSADGNLLLFQSYQSNVLVDLRKPAVPREFQWEKERIKDVNFVSNTKLFGRHGLDGRFTTSFFALDGTPGKTTEFPEGKYAPAWSVSGTGKYLAWCGDDGEIGIWDTASETRIETLRFEPPPTNRGDWYPAGVKFSPDGKFLAGCRSSIGLGRGIEIHVWDLRTGHRVEGWQLRTGNFTSNTGSEGQEDFEWLPDGSGWLWDTYLFSRTDGKLLGRVPAAIGAELPRSFVGRDQLLVFYLEDESFDAVLQTYTLEPSMVPPPWIDQGPRQLDPSQIVTPPAPVQKYVSNTNPAAEFVDIPVQPTFPVAQRISPWGEKALVGPWTVQPDPTPPGALLNLPANSVLTVKRGAKVTFSLTPSPFVFVDSPQEAETVWNLQTMTKVSANAPDGDFSPGVVYGLSPDGKYGVASYSGERSVFDCTQWREVGTLNNLSGASSNGVNFVTPDTLFVHLGKYSKSPGLWLYDRTGKIKHTLTGHSFAESTLRWNTSGTGRFLFAVELKGNIFVWETATGKLVGQLQFPPDGLLEYASHQGLAVSADGRHLAALRTWGNRYQIHLYDLQTGQHAGGWNWAYDNGQFPTLMSEFPLEWFPDGRGWRMDKMLVSRTDGKILGTLELDRLGGRVRYLVGGNQVLICQDSLGYSPVLRTLQTFTIPPAMVPPPWKGP